MKLFKTKNKKSYKFILMIFFVASIFCACGLDTFYNLQPPNSKIHEPTYSTADSLNKYFHFNTNDVANKVIPSFKYQGTAVYYKIYPNYSTMLSNNTSIDSVNSDTNYNAAAERMINSFGYKELHYSSASGIDPFVIPPTEKGVRQVKIHLTDYNAYNSTDKNADWSPYIEIDGERVGVPLRADESNKTFDFGREKYDKNKYEKPLTTDSDFVSGSFSSSYENVYFVDLYAVAIGFDVTFTNYYSNVLHLGAVSINSASETN